MGSECCVDYTTLKADAAMLYKGCFASDDVVGLDECVFDLCWLGGVEFGFCCLKGLVGEVVGQGRAGSDDPGGELIRYLPGARLWPLSLKVFKVGLPKSECLPPSFRVHGS